MKKGIRIITLILVFAMVAGMLPPVKVSGLEYVISITNAEEFMAIMDSPGSSYRLDANIDLGTIEPLGQTGNGFTGSLDGNGHTVSFSMAWTPGCKSYGLFSKLNSATISNLNVRGNIRVAFSEKGTFHVGMLAGEATNCSIGGGTISGSLDISGTAGTVYVGAMAGNASGSTLNNVTGKVDTHMEATGDMAGNYYGVAISCSPRDCYIYGSATLEGNIRYANFVTNGTGCQVSQNLTVRNTCNLEIWGISYGQRNYLSGKIEVLPSEGKTTTRVHAINGGTANEYSGNVNIKTATGNTVTGVMAKDGLGQTVTGNLTITGSGSGSGYGLEYCDSSTMNGNIAVFNGSPVVGLYDCTNCIFNGNLSLQTGFSYTRVRGAYKGEHNQVNGSLSISSTGDNAGVYGLIECPNSGFSGSLSAKGPTSAHAVGACNAQYNVVNATIKVDSEFNGSAYGVGGQNSCFDGSISCPGGSVRGCDANAIAKGSLSGQNVTASGAGGYFSGTIEAKYVGGSNSASVSIGGAASGTVSITSGKHGTHFSPGAYFKGTASITAEDGLISVTAMKGSSVSVTHKASGVSGSVESLINKGDQDDFVEIYWHRYAKQQNCTKDHDYFYYGYHSYNHYCYQQVMGLSIQECEYSDLDQMEWNGSIDPVNGTFKPDLPPVDYILKVTDPTGTVMHSCRIAIGGALYYPDVDGSIVVEDGPAIISPMVVELKNGDGNYVKVLNQTAYYPVPNMINTIRLEPTVEQGIVSLVAEGFPGSESGTEWGGCTVDIFGKSVDLFKNPMNLNLNGFGGALTYKNEHMKNGNVAFTMSMGISLDSLHHSAPAIARNPKVIAEELQKAGKMKKLKNGVVQVAGADLSAGVLGYVEMKMNPISLVWETTKSHFGLILDGSKRMTYHIPHTLGLVYVTGQLDFSGMGVLGLKEVAGNDSLESIKMNPYGTLSLTGGAEAGIGMGYRFSNVFVEGGGRGELATEWTLPHKSAKESLSMDLSFNGYVETRFLWMGRKYESVKGTFHLWPREEKVSLSPLPEGEYQVLPRTSPAPGGAYPYSEVQLVLLGDGRFVLVYTDDDTARGDADRSALRAMIGTNTDGQILWGDPITIENDGTGDFGFTACASGTNVALVWQDMDQSFGSGEGIGTEEAAAHVDLTQAVLDCSGDIPQVSRISPLPTEPGLYEGLPMIYFYSGPEGELLRCAWVTATVNDPTQADDTTLHTVWMSEGFGQPGYVVSEDHSAVTGIALLPGELLWSTRQGDTCDLWLRDSQGSVSCLKESGVMNLQSTASRFIYTVDNILYAGEGDYGSCRQQFISDSHRGSLRLSATGDICFDQLSTECSRVYRMDGETARPVGEFEGYLSSWDLAGEQVVTVLRSGFEDSAPAAMETGPLQVLEDLDLTIGIDNPAAAPGSQVTLAVEVTNEGTCGLTEIPVNVTAADGTVLYDQSQSVALETGSSTVVEVSFPIPEGFTPQDVTVTVAWQAETVHLGGSNLALSAQWSSGSPGIVTAAVSNTGHGLASGTVTVTDSSGNELARENVSLEAGDLQFVHLTIGSAFREATELTVTLTESQDAADSSDNQAIVTVTPVDARSVMVEPYLYVGVGRVQDVTINAFPSGARVSGLRYAIADGRVASVNADGTVTGLSSGETTLTVTESSGKEHFVTVRVTSGDEGQLPGENRNPFVDVPESEYYFEPVLWASEQKITAGATATTFEPDAGCTRAQVVTFLWRAAGSPEPSATDNPFSDIRPQDYFFKAVLWAVEKKITVGTAPDAFSPEDICTRAQVATFLYRYDGENRVGDPVNPFTDVPASEYYFDPVMWAVKHGITVGATATTFEPETQCNRAQIVTFLYRYMAD